MILERYLSRFDTDIEALILGCTHYPILRDRIDGFFDKKLPIIDSGEEAARKFTQYLTRHHDIKASLSTG
jgi:glutamate racemase